VIPLGIYYKNKILKILPTKVGLWKTKSRHPIIPLYTGMEVILFGKINFGKNIALYFFRNLKTRRKIRSIRFGKEIDAKYQSNFWLTFSIENYINLNFP
jgi:hypothetical protein